MFITKTIYGYLYLLNFSVRNCFKQNSITKNIIFFTFYPYFHHKCKLPIRIMISVKYDTFFKTFYLKPIQGKMSTINNYDDIGNN